MTRQRPFRFACGAFTASSSQAWSEFARRVEALGYHAFLMPDHFGQNLAPAVGLLAAAYATTSLRIGCTVFDNDFRHPAILANETATLDMLSDGRFEFGIGAGWVKREYEQTGIPFDAPGTRVDRMIEAVSIIKRLWSGEEVHHCGAHYTITGLTDCVRPVQQPHPPVFIGGGGKRLLTFAAQEADTVGILARARPAGGLGFGNDETDDAIARKVDWVRSAAGARFERLELAMLIWDVIITDNRRAAAETIASGARGVTADEVLASPYYLLGSVDAIVDQILGLRERFGISHFSVFPEDMEFFAPVVARLRGK
ncbi:MAG TPA: TIGR03621 family F420-dependent LLM class oxidoreductase [Thermomicrobiales bacterium]|nr:TIGR03621 family F420-dependent LLM class oxidoreductase [Thermomicrobiales bacterium]